MHCYETLNLWWWTTSSKREKLCRVVQSYKCNIRKKYIDKTATTEEEEENTHSISYHSLSCFTKQFPLCFWSWFIGWILPRISLLCLLISTLTTPLSTHIQTQTFSPLMELGTFPFSPTLFLSSPILPLT